MDEDGNKIGCLVDRKRREIILKMVGLLAPMLSM